jgi:hypothetical protein
MPSYLTQITITPEIASEVAVELRLDRPDSSECRAKVKRAFGILQKHRNGEIITVDRLGTPNEVFFVPSQGIWEGTEGKLYEVRLSPFWQSGDWSTCSCAEWRKQARKFHRLPFVPYTCKHGVAVCLTALYDTVYDVKCRADGTARYVIEGTSKPMPVSKVLAKAIADTSSQGGRTHVS